MAGPTVYTIPGGYQFIWPVDRVRVTVRRLRDERRGDTTKGEITVEANDPTTTEPIFQGQLTLTSPVSRRDVIKALVYRAPDVRWVDVVEALCIQTLKMHRQGEPMLPVGTRPLSGGQRYRLWPMVPEGVSTVLFGEGGTGKSFIATLAAVLVQSGGAFVGLRAEQGNVLYLDYETSAETLNERVAAICTGLQIPPFDIQYRYSFHPLADDIDSLRDMITDGGISFVVVDSLGPACGGDPNDAEMAIRMFNALRELRVTALLIDHIAKNQTEGGKPTPYGSVYKVNLARSVWQIKQGERSEDLASTVGIYHRKANYGPLRAPMGLTMRFTNDLNEQLTCMSFGACAVIDDPALSQEMPLRQRIVAILKSGKMTAHDIAVTLRENDARLTDDTVRVTLNRMRGNQAVKIGEEWGILERQPA
jgi:hypothetical protein